MHPHQRDWKAESPRSRAPRIQINNLAISLLRQHMRVTGYNATDTGFKLQVGYPMYHLEANLFHLYELHPRKLLRPRVRIDVPAHGVHRSDRSKLIEHSRRADITRMNDQLAPAQCLQRIAPHYAVRIRNQTDQAAHPAATIRSKSSGRKQC